METRVEAVSGPIVERLWKHFAQNTMRYHQVNLTIENTIKSEDFSKEKSSSFFTEDIDMVQELKDDHGLGWKEEYRSLRDLDKNIYLKLNPSQKLSIFSGTFQIDGEQRKKGDVAFSDGSSENNKSLSLCDNKQETIAFFGLLRQKISEKLAQRVQDFMFENNKIHGVAQVKFELQDSDKNIVRIEVGFTPDSLKIKPDEFPVGDEPPHEAVASGKPLERG